MVDFQINGSVTSESLESLPAIHPGQNVTITVTAIVKSSRTIDKKVVSYELGDPSVDMPFSVDSVVINAEPEPATTLE